MGSRMQLRSQQVAKDPGDQNCQPSQPRADELRKQKAEKPAEREVSEKMAAIAVKTERRRRSPDLSLADQARLSRTGHQPVEAEGLADCSAIQEQQKTGVGPYPKKCLLRRLHRQRRWGLVAVLSHIGGNLSFGWFGIGSCDEESCALTVETDPAGDTHGGQYQRIALRLAAQAAASDLHLRLFLQPNHVPPAPPL